MSDNKSPALEPIQKSAQAANALRGAIKTGKAIAGAAKGAAAGGPIGAGIMIAWDNRKLLVKIIVGIVAILMIPIMILCMLPALIFGGISFTGSGSTVSTPILNDAAAINQNITDVSTVVNAVLADALAVTLTEIQTDFEQSEAAQCSIIVPVAGELSYDAVRLISVYCAYHDAAVPTISLTDLEGKLRENINRFFYYTYTEENRAVMTTDPETGEEVPTTETDLESGEEIPVTELWRNYTVTYYGDTYFSTQIFPLNDAQQALAEDYAQNLARYIHDPNLNPAAISP